MHVTPADGRGVTTNISPLAGGGAEQAPPPAAFRRLLNTPVRNCISAAVDRGLLAWFYFAAVTAGRSLSGVAPGWRKGNPANETCDYQQIFSY
jgi:hypothetical protein